MCWRAHAERGGKFMEFGAQGSQCGAGHAAFVTGAGHSIVWLSDLLVPDERGEGDCVRCVGGLGTATRVQRAFQGALDALPGRIFVSFDIDAVRGADCPGVSCPAGVGLTAEDACRICFAAGADPRVDLIDMSELNPVVEEYRSPRLAVLMFYYALMGLAVRKRGARS